MLPVVTYTPPPHVLLMSTDTDFVLLFFPLWYSCEFFCVNVYRHRIFAWQCVFSSPAFMFLPVENFPFSLQSVPLFMILLLLYDCRLRLELGKRLVVCLSVSPVVALLLSVAFLLMKSNERDNGRSLQVPSFLLYFRFPDRHVTRQRLPASPC